MKEKTGLIAALTLVTSLASAQEMERVPVTHLQLQGGPKLEVVALPKPSDPNLTTYVCIREYDAPAIRCYAVDMAAHTWRTVDLELNK